MQNNVGIYASQISGHLWAPGGAYDALATVTVPSGGAASITFAGIPTGYKHLQIRGILQVNTGVDAVKIQFNSDTTDANYARHRLQGNGTTASATGAASSYLGLSTGIGISATANTFSAVVLDILDYTNTSKYKTTRSLSGYDANGSGGIELDSGLWQNTSAITTITLTPATYTFQQYSQLALYGVK